MAIKREQVVRTAEKYASRGKVDAAIREYRKVLAEAPDDATTLNRVGDLYARTDRVDEAVRLFNQIAENFTADGFFVKAIAIYKKIVKLDPIRLEAYEKLASLYHRQGLLNEARTQYQVLADYYLKHDNRTSAIAIYERLAEVDPSDPALRVHLADLYREMKLLDRAVDEYRKIAEMMLAAGHAEEAEQVYRRALEIDASDVGFITDAVLKLREAGQVGRAAHLLAEAVARNPEATQVGRLVGLREDEAGAGAEEAEAGAAAEAAVATPGEAAAPPDGPPSAATAVEEAVEEADAAAPGEGIPAAAAAEPLATPDEAQPSFDTVAGADFDGEIELDLDEVFVLDLDDDSRPESLVEPPATPDLGERADATRERRVELDPEVLERTVAEVRPERVRVEEDLYTEAEVLAKYGLAGKAADRVGELLELNPTHVGGLGLSLRLHLELDEHDAAAADAQRLRTIVDERSEVWQATVEALRLAGFAVTAEEVVPPAPAPSPAPTALPADEEGAARAASVVEDLVAPQLPEGAVAPDGEPWAESPEVAETTPAEEPAAAAAPPPAGRRGRHGRPDIDRLLAEIAAAVRVPRRRAPARPGEEAAPAAAPAAEEVPAPAPEESTAAASAPDGGPAGDAATQWLSDVEPVAAAAEGDQGFFRQEEDFFDLAAEIEEELTREGALEEDELLLEQPREQTLEEIVEGFKKGVAETLSPEDHATHFELGIAYREMGLLDEAIGEFQIAAKLPSLLVSCCSMLGLAFVAKGLPELAVKWYRRGLAAPQLGEDDQSGLLYDLADALVAVGDRDSAYETLVELYGINSNYRDVVARLEETRPRA
jgi:tetratricopeptide (TPR) repeat protein